MTVRLPLAVSEAQSRKQSSKIQESAFAKHGRSPIAQQLSSLVRSGMEVEETASGEDDRASNLPRFKGARLRSMDGVQSRNN